MQRINHLSAAAALLLLSAPIQASEVGIDFYGKFDVSFQNSGVYHSTSQSVEHSAYTYSNGSRMGLRMAGFYTEDLRVFIQLESAVDFNTDHSYDVHFSNRNTFVGFGGSWGDLLIGQNDSPLKMSQGNIDLFSDSDSQMWPLQRGENRVSDVIQFNSTKMGDWIVSAAVSKNPSTAENNYGLSATLKYEADGIYSAIAIDRDILDYDVMRWVGSYQFGRTTVNALVQESTSTKTGESNRGYTLSSSYMLDEYLVKLQYTYSDEIIRGGEFLTLGLDWRYDESLLLYTFYTERDADDKSGEGDLLSFGMKYQF